MKLILKEAIRFKLCLEKATWLTSLYKYAHPSFVSCAHSWQSTNSSQDHLWFACFNHVEQQRHSVVLEDSFCSGILSGQHNQVVGSLDIKGWVAELKPQVMYIYILKNSKKLNKTGRSENTHFFPLVFSHFIIKENVKHVLYPRVCGERCLELCRVKMKLSSFPDTDMSKLSTCILFHVLCDSRCKFPFKNISF